MAHSNARANPTIREAYVDPHSQPRPTPRATLSSQSRNFVGSPTQAANAVPRVFAAQQGPRAALTTLSGNVNGQYPSVNTTQHAYHQAPRASANASSSQQAITLTVAEAKRLLETVYSQWHHWPKVQAEAETPPLYAFVKTGRQNELYTVQPNAMLWRLWTSAQNHPTVYGHSPPGLPQSGNSMRPPVVPAKAAPKKARKTRAKNKEEPQEPLDMTAFHRQPKGRIPQSNQPQRYQTPEAVLPGDFQPAPQPGASQRQPMQQTPPIPQAQGAMNEPPPMPQRGSMHQSPHTTSAVDQKAHNLNRQSAGYQRLGSSGSQRIPSGPATGAPKFGYPHAAPPQFSHAGPVNGRFSGGPSQLQFPQQHWQQSTVPVSGSPLAGRKRQAEVFDIWDDDAHTTPPAKKARTERNILRSDSVQPEAALKQNLKHQSPLGGPQHNRSSATPDLKLDPTSDRKSPQQLQPEIASSQNHNRDSATRPVQQTRSPVPLTENDNEMSSFGHSQDQPTINMPIGDLDPSEAEAAMKLALDILRTGKAVASIHPGEIAVSIPDDSVMMYLPPDSAVAYYGRVDAEIQWKQITAISFKECLNVCQQRQALERAGVPRQQLMTHADVTHDLLEGPTLIGDCGYSEPPAIPQNLADQGTNGQGAADRKAHLTSSPDPAQQDSTGADDTIAASSSFKPERTDDNQQQVAQTPRTSVAGSAIEPPCVHSKLGQEVEHATQSVLDLIPKDPPIPGMEDSSAAADEPKPTISPIINSGEKFDHEGILPPAELEIEGPVGAGEKDWLDMDDEVKDFLAKDQASADAAAPTSKHVAPTPVQPTGKTAPPAVDKSEKAQKFVED